MSNTFYPGQKNYIQILNTMYDAYAAGPYSALPLAGGTMLGPLASISSISCEGDLWSTKRVITPKIHVGVQGADPDISVISRIGSSQGSEVLALGNVGSFYHGDGGIGNGLPTCLNISRNDQTGRSINSKGTINASGADYAEYMIKSSSFAFKAGDIVGINNKGNLTHLWEDSIAFLIKSTNPCMVGGDNWSESLGDRPSEDHLQAEYDTKLEESRKTVDRIAFAGQVPVNILNTSPGQYIIPVKDGTGIKAVAVNESDMTLQQLMKSVGKVIAIEEDGRARVIVKAV